MKLKVRPLPFEKLSEEEIYVMRRHGYADLYRKMDGKLEFLCLDDNSRWEWCRTCVDVNTAKFSLIQPMQIMGALVESKFLDKKKKHK